MTDSLTDENVRMEINAGNDIPEDNSKEVVYEVSSVVIECFKVYSKRVIFLKKIFLTKTISSQSGQCFIDFWSYSIV